jgi:hypothetical protein
VCTILNVNILYPPEMSKFAFHDILNSVKIKLTTMIDHNVCPGLFTQSHSLAILFAPEEAASVSLFPARSPCIEAAVDRGRVAFQLEIEEEETKLPKVPIFLWLLHSFTLPHAF